MAQLCSRDLHQMVRKRSSLDYEIKLPTVPEMKESAAFLESNRPNGQLLSGIFGITDGRSMPCAYYTNSEFQNSYWEVFTQELEVTI